MTEQRQRLPMTDEQAEEYARLVEAAASGDGAAAWQLGDMYREGLGGLRYSPREAFRWYAKSAMAGYACGQNNLGACYEHGLGCRQSYAKASKWYRLAAAQQLGTASMNLGHCYLRGMGVPADRAETFRLFRLAVAQGEPKAREDLERLAEPLTSREPAKPVDLRWVDETVPGRSFGLVGVGELCWSDEETSGSEPGGAPNAG